MRQLLEDGMDHRRHLGVMTDREPILAHDVDVALVKLAEASALGSLAAVHALDLIAAEREMELVLVLGHVTRERHREIETQSELGRMTLLQRARGLDEIDLPLGLAATLGQQASASSMAGVSMGRKPCRS